MREVGYFCGVLTCTARLLCVPQSAKASCISPAFLKICSSSTPPEAPYVIRKLRVAIPSMMGINRRNTTFCQSKSCAAYCVSNSRSLNEQLQHGHGPSIRHCHRPMMVTQNKYSLACLHGNAGHAFAVQTSTDTHAMSCVWKPGSHAHLRSATCQLPWHTGWRSTVPLADMASYPESVSYTHLTLPTILLV